MISGLYKYIVFDPVERSTGKVYDEPCHRILGTGDDLPNTDWVAANHWCVPLYYRPASVGDREPAVVGAPMSRVLVTGGSGFIGSHVVDALLEAGRDARNYDLRTSPYHGADEIETVIGDLTDRETLTEALDGCDAIIHLAAHADVGLIVDDPAGAERANACGTLTVLEACRAADVKRVVYGSTIWVYGESADDPVTEDRAWACRSTSTPPASSPARCTARPTRSSTASSRRSCASASRTGPGLGRQP